MSTSYHPGKHSKNVAEIFDLIDKSILDIFTNHQDTLDQELNEFYWEFWNEPKKRTGTSQGISGFIAEYIVLKTLLIYLEKYHQIRLSVPLTSADWYYRSFSLQSEDKTFEVKRSMPLDSDQKIKPDITIKKNNRVIALFEIKTFDDAGSDFEKFDTMLTLSETKDALKVYYSFQGLDFTKKVIGKMDAHLARSNHKTVFIIPESLKRDTSWKGSVKSFQETLNEIGRLL